jgi:hypothetical protein
MFRFVGLCFGVLVRLFRGRRSDVGSIPIARSKIQGSDPGCAVELATGNPFGSEIREGPPQHLLDSQIDGADIR